LWSHRFNKENAMYPAVKSVSPRKEYKLFIEFDNSEFGILDMCPYLDFGIFSTIKDPALFRQVRVSFDTIEWCGGIDLDPKFVYEKCVKQRR
jgi:hypothetical protein